MIRFLLGVYFFLNIWIAGTAQSLLPQQKNALIKQLKQDLKLSGELTSQGYYPEAYDKVWNILIIADSLNEPSLKYKAYKNLTSLYSIFLDKKNALASIDSMKFYAKQAGILTNNHKNYGEYHAIAVAYRINKKYDEASSYLDISERLMDSLQIPLKKRIYHLTEKAHLKTLTGDYDASEKILKQLEPIISVDHQYSSIMYSMLGDLYKEKGNIEKALSYFSTSLSIINHQNNRIGVKVDLLEKMANLYKSKGNYKIALEHLNASKTLKDSLFGSQSSRNQQLFEINDGYRKSILENKKIQKEQEVQLLTAQKDKLNTRLFFSILLFILTTIASIFFIRLIRKKHTAEKKLVQERAEAEIEIKKKELAVTALQLMEKDKLLNEIKNGLDDVEKQKDTASIKKLKSTINVNSSKMWEEFETRFVKVNNTFYESLQEKHPNLSRNDLKLSALIKLNFSSKEMAQLLGISTDSVNKARYRLRKKLGLNRDDNLVTYMTSI